MNRQTLLFLVVCGVALQGATAICPYSEGDVIRCTTDHAIHRIQGGRKRYYSGGAYTADGTPPPTVDGQEVCTARRQCEDGPDMPDPTISVQEQHEQRMAAITLSSEEGAAHQQEAVAKRLTRTAAGVSGEDALQGDGVTFLDDSHSASSGKLLLVSAASLATLFYVRRVAKKKAKT